MLRTRRTTGRAMIPGTTAAVVVLLAMMAAAHTAAAQQSGTPATAAVEGRFTAADGGGAAPRTIDELMKMDLKLTVDAGVESGDFDVSTSRRIVRTETPRAVDGAERAVRVEYSVVDEVLPMGAAPAKTAKPKLGRVYLVTWKDSIPVVAAEDGAALESHEREFVTEEYRRSLLPERFSALIAGRNFAPGDRVDIPYSLFTTFLRNSTSNEIRDVSVRYAGERLVDGQRCGVFDMSMQVSTDATVVVMELAFTGEFVFAFEGARPMSMKMTAPVTAAGTDASMQITGAGTMEGRLHIAYGGAK